MSLKGILDLELNCHEHNHKNRSFGLTISVEVDVEANFDRETDGSRGVILSTTPTRVHSIVGGNAFKHDEWSEIVGPLRDWILKQLENVTATELNLTDAEILQYAEGGV